ncbi:MAG TPA: hypothetical protein PLN52_26415 [Opitutaceae bacterium]|nr:hypothetical protein [Opitutaceae bacterium]
MLSISERAVCGAFIDATSTIRSPWSSETLESGLYVGSDYSGLPGRYLFEYVPPQIRRSLYSDYTISLQYERGRIESDGTTGYQRTFFDGDWTPLGRRTLFSEFGLAKSTYSDLVRSTPLTGVAVLPRSFTLYSESQILDDNTVIGPKEIATGWTTHLRPLLDDIFVPLIPAAGELVDPQTRFWPETGLPYTREQVTTDYAKPVDPFDIVVDGRLWNGEDLISAPRITSGHLISRRLVAALRELGIGPIVLRPAFVRLDGVRPEIRSLASEMLRSDLPLENTESMIFLD